MRRPEVGDPLQIRAMEANDFAAAHELLKSSFAHPWTPELLRKELEHDWSTVLVAELDGAEGRRLVAMGVFWFVHDELHVLNLAVHRELRRQGLARALLQRAFETALSRGCVLVTLEVARSNGPALALYRALGFREVGVRRNYYAEDNEDALVMVLELVRGGAPQ